VSYGGVLIGTFTGGSAGADLEILLNANASPAAATALMQAISYENTNTDNPAFGNRLVSYVLTDGDGGTSATVQTSINFNAANDIPVINNLAGDIVGFREGDGEQPIDQFSDALVFDADSFDFDSGSLTVALTAGGYLAEDVLSIENQGTGAGQISISGSVVSYQGAVIGSVSGVTYLNTDSDNPTSGNRRISFTLTDGDGGTSVSADTTISLTSVNDNPVVQNLADDILNVAEGDGEAVIDQSSNAVVFDVDSVNFDQVQV